MPTEENQNVQTGGNPTVGDDSNSGNTVSNNVVNNNSDIDLNLDGVDIPEVKEEVKSNDDEETVSSTSGEIEDHNSEPVQEKLVENESVIPDNGDDWLVEEDKKVEELQQEEKVEDGISNPKIDEVSDTVESVMESPVEEEIDNLEEEQLEELKPIVEDEEVEFPVSKESIVEEKTEEETQESKEDSDGQLDLDNLDFEEEKTDKIKSDELKTNQVTPISPEKEEVELHKENLGEDVVENEQGDIVSDTGEMNSDKGGYVPNEHDFGEVTKALNTADTGGAIDLGSLETNIDESKNLEAGVNVDIKSETNEIKSEGLDLDSMISDLGNTEGLDAEKSIVAEPVVAGVAEVAKVVPEVVANGEVEQLSKINSGATTESVNTVATLPGQAVVMSEAPHKKSSHTGLKIFLFIIVLFVGGVFILSKMYPQEISDIVSAIKGEDITVIEYSDNADSGVVLEETENNSISTGDTEDVDELDPNSLAGQLEGNNGSGYVNNNIEYTTTGFEETGHNANMTGDAFDAFEGLEEVMDPVTSANAEFLDELNQYKEKGEEYNIWGRGINNTIAMKYGSYISKKAGEVITDVENGTKIDNVKVENYFAQFDKYLEKLNGLRESIDGAVQGDALVSSGIDDSTTETTTGTVQ